MLCAVKTMRARSRTVAGSDAMASPHVARVGIDEAVVFVPVIDVRDLDVAHSASDRFRARVEDVLPVLRAARIRTLGRADEPDGPLHSGVGHLRERIGQQRMPVAHANENRKLEPGRGQSCAEAIRLPHRNFGERRHASEMLVVTDNFLDPLLRYAATTQHIREERTDVGQTLRTAERNHKDGIKWSSGAHGDLTMVGHARCVTLD